VRELNSVSFNSSFRQRRGESESAALQITSDSRQQPWKPGDRQLFEKDDAILDLSKLNDDKLELLERLLKKAAGEFDGDVAPRFRVEFVNRNTIESNAAAVPN
jgi:hypothetical protein